MNKNILDFQKKTRFNKGSLEIPYLYVKKFFKSYPRFDSFKLLKSKETKLDKIIISRQCIRNFNQEKTISFKEISALLNVSLGIKFHESNEINKSTRNYPSAGARYPIETYIFNLNIVGLKKGLYHYEIKSNSLEFIYDKDDIEDDIKEILKLKDLKDGFPNASCYILFTAVHSRTSLKYGNRGFRFLYLDAGHMGQNLCLKSEELGLGITPLGGFNEDKIIDFLDLDENKEFPVYMFVLGKRE